MVVTQHADFVLAPAPRLQGAIDAGREGLVQALRRGLPDMVGAQIRTVRVVIGHGVRVEELVHAIPVTPVDDFVQVHPMLDHLGLSRGKTGGAFCTLLLRQNEVGFGKEWKSTRLNSSPY